MTSSTFNDLLTAQIGNEFSASQQYIAIAVWFDNHDLPQLAAHFYQQSVEERNHAMMLVQYRLDRDLGVTIPGVAAPKTEFADVVEPIALALAQEQEVTSQIEALFRAARADGDAIGEQAMLWFLKEQVEEVASMSTLVTIAKRAGDNLFDIENFIARETIGDSGQDADAPAAAGGAL
ncbi:bacterioferritin [Pseudoclavibacter sp. RFBJ3]|uniref:ferritin n=1 Tax=unclassified Pseudoclavibacter TaxID=2615177 RepID=UPI000CE8C43C|nr:MULTISPECIES: ferritin [unclassified Pseudoclavibacter]MBF4458787.1 ferritin [Pseudoclavibacter sp. VKM Ac-2867]MBF4550738.1 ferritin [Pseudoclavibacter sp. VKM Ac-2888]PPF34617.1 bacterioferritin [Pseudoclavibacter sp. AY1H1]PPF77970.1 bacterioferritin [Pseudoclavibacter sp. Z016]PPF86410.1 bacterioferritin [Pseudoclavibacter sp. RFBJ5]